MKIRPTLTIATLLVMLLLAIYGLFRGTQSARTESKMSVLLAASSAVVLPTPDYTVPPGDTDGTPGDLYGNQPDCPGLGIGCDDDQWELDGKQLPSPWGEGAINVEHRFYLPPSLTDTSKLLVFLGGGNGGSRGGEYIGPIAAQLGYHVLALTYPAAQANSCSGESTPKRKRDCFGNAFREVVFGINSPNPGGDETNVGQHPQDALVNRLEKALKWAADNKPTDHGWGRYLTNTGEVDWTKVHLAGMSNGSSHGSFMGSLVEFRDVGRVSLFAGPDDGEGGATEETWNPATYIQEAMDTGSRYYGLVHVLNKAPTDDDSVVFKVTKNWLTFGMEGPLNAERLYFDPTPGFTPDFGAAHMLISTDPFTDYIEAHESVAHDRDCIEYGPKDEEDPNSKPDCKKWGDEPIGYEPAWRCVLGTGDSYASAKPIANAGGDQTVECEGGGGSDVVLDGSASRDPDCDILTYAWAGTFGLASGRKPSVFLPLGTNAVALSVRDGWWWSLFSDTTQITVADTVPPSLQVQLSPTRLWPPNHKLVRIDATINVADSCGGSPPQVELTSISSNQPDDGTGDGDKTNDIQEADFGTLDRSFLLRAERAGGDPNGRIYTITYTATDASGNKTQTSATVKVPHSK